MENLGALKEIVEFVQTNGAGNALTVAILFFLWKMDRRLFQLEVHFGIKQVSVRDEAVKQLKKDKAA